jgi:hypothetical protein
MIFIRIVTFRLKDQIRRKFRVTPERFDALDYITSIQIESFSSDNDLMPFETWTSWKMRVNDAI